MNIKSAKFHDENSPAFHLGENNTKGTQRKELTGSFLTVLDTHEPKAREADHTMCSWLIIVDIHEGYE